MGWNGDIGHADFLVDPIARCSAIPEPCAVGTAVAHETGTAPFDHTIRQKSLMSLMLRPGCASMGERAVAMLLTGPCEKYEAPADAGVVQGWVGLRSETGTANFLDAGPIREYD